MKLYYSPGACSLAAHIALREAGIPFESEGVDLKEKVTASGADFNVVNPKGYVEVVTENPAVLDYIATQAPTLGLEGPLGRTRLLEGLAYVSTEPHKSNRRCAAARAALSEMKGDQDWIAGVDDLSLDFLATGISEQMMLELASAWTILGMGYPTLSRLAALAESLHLHAAVAALDR